MKKRPILKYLLVAVRRILESGDRELKIIEWDRTLNEQLRK